MMTTKSKEPISRAPRVRLPDDVMHRLSSRGVPNIEIIEVLERDHGIRATQSSVSHWKRRHGYAVRKSTPQRLELIPWRVASAHQGDRARAALATEARVRAGERPNRASALGLARLREELGADRVVHYDRVNGFVLVPARAGIDEDMIRDPRIADNGDPIVNPDLWQ